MVQVMTCRHSGDKSLPEPMMTQFADAYTPGLNMASKFRTLSFESNHHLFVYGVPEDELIDISIHLDPVIW